MEKRCNRLGAEKSPYLLQHAGNPVDWYPWGAEAFTRAKQENKPIFLSIGYSTCHWCHVMAYESFADERVAALLNESFVCVKVDREERPDIDGIYMQVCQMMTGSGGWPLTVILTPDREPFFAGTYFPKETLFGRIGMLELIPKITELWEKQQQQVVKVSHQMTRALQKSAQTVGGPELGEEMLHQVYQQLAERYDRQHGGFGGAPKFPSPQNLSFLLRYWKRYRKEEALGMVENTLQAMRRGGIYDHIGFGFHRYSTDHKWLVPHFEKMLYDQALLAMIYAEAYQATGKERYGQTVREIMTYVLRDMRAPEGGFYSAEDADSEGYDGRESGRVEAGKTPGVVTEQRMKSRIEGEPYLLLIKAVKEGDYDMLQELAHHAVKNIKDNRKYGIEDARQLVKRAQDSIGWERAIDEVFEGVLSSRAMFF